MLFRLFKSQEIEDAAKAMSDRFAKRCPPELQEDPRAEQKREGAMSALYSDLAELRKRVKLGMYRKAEFANTLKWELKGRGYKPAFVNAVVYDMLIHLASSKKKG